MNNNIGIETQIRSLTKLLEDMKQGQLQVPPFQRDFVWTRDDVKDLFDSIKNNYPIGSILLWRPKTAPQWSALKTVGSFSLPNYNSNQQVFLLDGFQRMSSLFGCLTNPVKSGLQCDEDSRTALFDLYFDLEDESFTYLRNYPKPYQVPVYILMSTSDFRQYSRKNIEPYCDAEKLDMYLDSADAFSRSLIDYKLAVVEISDADLSDAVNIFSRVNSKGTEISYDWMVNALSYSQDFNFSIEIDNLKEQLSQYHFESISRNNLFRCYQSAFDDKLYIDQTNIEKLAVRPDFKDVVKNTTPCILRAVKFLYKELNVVEYKLLPYNTQLVFVMTFFSKLSNPTKKQLDELKRWFWVTTYSNYFTIYSLSYQRKAFNQFIDFLNGKEENSVFSDNPESEFKTLPFPPYILLSGVRSKALILFELHKTREYSKKSPTTYGLTLGKIAAVHKSTPENIVPTFIAKKNKSFNPIVYSLNIEKNSSVVNPLLPYREMFETDEEYLARRKFALVEEERKFVRQLGLTYTMPK